MTKCSLKTVLSAPLVVILALIGQTTYAASPNSGAPTNCPYQDHAMFRQLLQEAVSENNNDFNNPMWAVLVNRSGVVCMVAFSGESFDSQWLLSRQIAASKAFTANGLSIVQSGVLELFDTRDLDPLVQPGQPLYGLAPGNPLDPAAAYKGPISKWGTKNDPMVGNRVGGTITFGGGVATVQSGDVTGALGLSGDSVVRDHDIAVSLRSKLNLAP